MSGIPGPDPATALTRRRLLAGGSLSLLGVGAALRTLQALAEAAPAAAQGPGEPNAEVRATMAAIADTIVPGPAGGADRAPGAIESGALDEIYDPFYGVAEAFGVIAADIQLATPRILGRPARFELALPYADRERVLRDRMTEHPAGGTNPLATAYGAVAVLVYLSHYGTPRSEIGPRSIGFPPQSDGYRPGHSYRIRFRRMTRHGNPP